MNNNDEDDWFTICDEKHIILEKNSSNAYKITFSIHSTGGEDTVLNVLKNGQFFELLAALNPDVIDTINVTEHANNVHDVFITFKNNSNKDGEELDKIIDVYFSLKYSFKENKCIITSNNIQNDDKNNSSESDSRFKKDGREFLPVSRINLKAVEKNNKTSMCLIFKVDSKKSSNIINMYIGLYFKKIFYRFKQYFE
jgi:hypothetical protein